MKYSIEENTLECVENMLEGFIGLRLSIQSAALN